MQAWLQGVLVAAAAVTAVGVLWTKAVRPLIKFISLMERTLPLLEDLTDAFIGEDNAFDVLKEIVQQVRTDSGSSLLDIVNRIETASITAAELAKELQVGVEASRQLAQQDRGEVRELMLKLDRLTVRVTDNAASIAERDEAVAENLAAATRKVEGIAADLDESQQRADEIVGPHGAAADAAAQSQKEDDDERKEP